MENLINNIPATVKQSIEAFKNYLQIIYQYTRYFTFEMACVFSLIHKGLNCC